MVYCSISALAAPGVLKVTAKGPDLWAGLWTMDVLLAYLPGWGVEMNTHTHTHTHIHFTTVR